MATAERPWRADDFTSNSLCRAWLNFHKAVQKIDDLVAQNQHMTDCARAGFAKLRDQHMKRIQTLEEAQRIINTDAMIQRILK